MKLHAKLLDRFVNAERRFNQFTKKFAEFVETLEFFKQQRCPVPGVEIKKTDDPLCVIAVYRTVSISLRMLCELSKDSVALARVVCVLETPSFAAEKRILGSFTFNGQGFTDFEPEEGEDPLEVQYMAPEIVLHFLHLALESSFSQSVIDGQD
jgi:hypothetical protein